MDARKDQFEQLLANHRHLVITADAAWRNLLQARADWNTLLAIPPPVGNRKRLFGVSRAGLVEQAARARVDAAEAEYTVAERFVSAMNAKLWAFVSKEG